LSVFALQQNHNVYLKSTEGPISVSLLNANTKLEHGSEKPSLEAQPAASFDPPSHQHHVAVKNEVRLPQTSERNKKMTDGKHW
jgi:hypothetical protein